MDFKVDVSKLTMQVSDDDSGGRIAVVLGGRTRGFLVEDALA